jgi:hypothetical protein
MNYSVKYAKQFSFSLILSMLLGASYGNTLSWAPGQQPGMGEQLVEVQQDLDKEKFYKEYIDLLTRLAPIQPAKRGIRSIVHKQFLRRLLARL